MNIAISFPPIINSLGQKAMISQNRNVQYFSVPTYLLGITHAQAATSLKKKGYNVYWDDGNAQLKTYEKWLNDLIQFNPKIIIFESTTPVMHLIWQTINTIKKQLPNSIIVMTGYHSMRKPEETLNNSLTDIVILSNHVDFVLDKLIKELFETNFSLKDISCEGIAYKNNTGEFFNNKSFKKIEDVNKSEIIDRDLVQWKNYAYENGNFLQTPGTYATSVIRDCTFGKCTFCRYNGPELSFSIMNIKKSVDEYENLIKNYGVREIFDDSGVWYRGSDARNFAKEIIARKLHKKNCYFGFNTRFEYLDEETIKLLSKANFRFVLIGLESGSDFTLNKLKKGYTRETVVQTLKVLKKYNLHPHLTIMVGYYWETKEMLAETVNFVKELMFKGLARTLQVTLCTPLDYTPYHQECIDNKVLIAKHYQDHDMSKLIVKTPIPHEEYYKAVKEMYFIAFHPKFIFRQIMFLFKFHKRDWQFLLTYSIRAIRRVRQHVFNLTKSSKAQSIKI
jgi:anaerobic magnesium-protoporphyrin IX monomethyl ester cyclase